MSPPVCGGRDEEREADEATDEEGARTERRLGLLVARGTLLTSIAPADGSELIANPFAAGAEEEEGAVLG